MDYLGNGFDDVGAGFFKIQEDVLKTTATLDAKKEEKAKEFQAMLEELQKIAGLLSAQEALKPVLPSYRPAASWGEAAGR